MARCPHALLLLLCMLTAAARLEVAEGAKKVKDREDALQAAKGKSPKVLRDNATLTPEARRRDQLGGCLNQAVNMVGTQRRRGNSPQRTKAKKDTADKAASPCLDTAADACEAPEDVGTDGTSSGRRLQTLLAVDIHALSLEESREHLRELLQAGDDDDWEVANVDLDDDDNALLVEEIAANMAKEDVDDFCDAMNQPEMEAIVQSYTNPSAVPISAASAGIYTTSSLRFNSDGKRIRLRDHFKQMREQQAQAQAMSQGVKAASSTPDCRAKYGTGVSAMKDTTMRRVKCNAITKLARNIIPNYPFQGSPKTDGSANIGGAGLNGFQVTMDGIPRFLKARQQDPDDLSVRYKEYSDADVWGDETDIALIFELSLNTLEKTLAAVKGACDTGDQFYIWAGLFAGAKTTVSRFACTPLGLVAQIVLLVLRTTIDSYKYRLGVAGNHDLIVQTAEVETIAENAVTTIHNSKILFNYVSESSTSTQDLVKAVAGQTRDLVGQIKQKIDDLDAKLTNLVQKRSCDLQNAAANNHNSLNHVQRLLLVPQGSRPGYKDKGDPTLTACGTTTPVTCSHATRNTTSPINAGSLCLLDNESPTQSPLIQSSAVLPELTVLPEKVSAQDRTARNSP